jgi:hypothetical protein
MFFIFIFFLFMSKKNNIYPILGDNFNKKTTQNNDINRISNIHSNLNRRIPMFKHQPSLLKESAVLNDYTDSNIKISNFYQTNSNINLTLQREDNKHKIPKITLKEISIPNYSISDKFDLNVINETINQNIQMSITQPTIIYDNIDDINVSLLKNKNIHKIYHIYQEKYLDNVFPSGLGDFIRSCFFIIQFCTKYSFEYEIVINHPIAIFLNKFSHNFSNYNSKICDKQNISMFKETNWLKNSFDEENYIQHFQLKREKLNEFVQYLNRLPIINNSIFSYNIFFPINIISPQEKIIMRSIFQPTSEIYQYLNQTFYSLNINSKNFIAIHLRSGDIYLNNQSKMFNYLYLNVIKNEIIKIIFNNKNTDILLIADNNEIKYLLKNEFPFIKVYFKEITHLGEGSQLTKNKIKNTLLDFYLLSHSQYIYSFTCYPHGTGFSYWCSVIYNIPYKCKFINIKEF